ncbi:hypothetical protein EGR_11253 [Echinococcus granulosus]|uniref:Uncharacterized protein n=1 Tax=Echinococcus granulosus TaxID=6210 RepID=W6TYT4_ECHGR|nr:hypothetical protein EGR_11253 [Echinococcus granulosus]EUB53893.1 hypothetical protein EGR_11253 [Echinococcus granulosus]
MNIVTTSTNSASAASNNNESTTSITDTKNTEPTNPETTTNSDTDSIASISESKSPTLTDSMQKYAESIYLCNAIIPPAVKAKLVPRQGQQQRALHCTEQPVAHYASVDKFYQ